MRDVISKSILSHIDVAVTVLWDKVAQIEKAAQMILETLSSNGKIVFFGNGGSAADSQHLAAEMVGRFLRERPALPAISLVTDTSVISAVGNDYGFDKIFQRQVESLVGKNDLVIALSTSGNSKNVINGVIAARKIGAKAISLTGEGGGSLAEHSNLLLEIPIKETPRIQEMHILIGHIICDLVEKEILSKGRSRKYGHKVKLKKKA